MVKCTNTADRLALSALPATRRPPPQLLHWSRPKEPWPHASFRNQAHSHLVVEDGAQPAARLDRDHNTAEDRSCAQKTC